MNQPYELIDRARQAGLDVRPVRMSYPLQDSKKTVITIPVLNGDDLSVTIWPSGLITKANSMRPMTVEDAARYLRLYPKEQ